MRIPTFLIALGVFFAACSNSPAPKPTAPVASEIFSGLQADEVWHLPGLKGRVEVARDKYGIPHFYADTLHDLMVVQGYVVARDRFWEMDVFRRIATGRISTLIGLAPVLLDFDELFRSLNLTENGEMVYDQIYREMGAQDKDFLDAYTLGVNTYLEHAATGEQGAKIPPEYNELVLGLLFHPSPTDIPRWLPTDTIAIGRFQQWNLSGSNIARELTIGKMHQEMLSEKPAWIPALLRFRPAVTTASIEGWADVHPGVAAAPKVIQPLTIDVAPTLAKLQAMSEALPLLMWNDNGSNNWVVGPTRSETGHVLLANDPHLIMTNPPLFYQAHFNTKERHGEEDWNAYGVVFPGIPVFMIAHTEKIAWGVTVLGYDVMDIYKEEVVQNGTAVRRGATTVPIAYSQQTYCHGYSTECVDRLMQYVPGHGPRVQHEKDFLTFKWTGMEATQDFSAFRKLMTADDVPEAMVALRDFKVGAQNFVLGDTKGNFAYLGHANIPIRDPACPQPPYMPQDGASGNCEWTGFLANDKIPFAVNPEIGYIGTANNDIVGTSFDNDLTNDENYYWLSRDAGFRMARMKELFDAKPKFAKADMERIAADVYSKEGSLMVPFILAAGDDAAALGIPVSPEVKTALETLRRWTFETTTGLPDPFTGKTPTAQQKLDSVATSIYYTWVRLLKEPFTGDEFAMYGMESPSETDGYEPLGTIRQALHSLQDPAAEFLWDDVSTPAVETKEAIMLKVMQESVDWLTERFETEEQSEWHWGTIHFIRFFDPYGLLGSSVRAIGPYPNDGALGTLDAASPLFLFGNFMQLGGPQMRMVTELDPAGVKSWNSLPGGQVHDRESPHYDDLVPTFMKNETFAVPFHLADVAASLERLTIVLPE